MARPTRPLSHALHADLVILDRNPLDNIRDTLSISFTMLDGMLLDRDLNAVAGGIHRTKPFWFQQGAGMSFTQGTTQAVGHED